MSFKQTKWQVGFMIMALILFLTACGGSGAGNNSADGSNTPATSKTENTTANKKPKIAIVEIDLITPFFVQVKEAGDKAAKDYGVDIVWQSCDNSLEKQISIIENFIQQKVDVIGIDPVDAKGIIPVVKKAKEAGIQVVTMGNKVEGDWNHNTLYPDATNFGMVARAIGTALGGKGQVAYLTGSAGNYVSDVREKGFVDVMKKEFPGIELVGVQPTNYDPAEAQRVTETWLNNYPNLNAIGFISYPTGLAAITTAEAKGRKLIFAGNDGAAEMHPYINNGTMLLDAINGASRVGYWNVAAMARLAKGVKLPTDLFLYTPFVTSDDTAKSLKGKGLEFEYITPDKGLKVLSGYEQEFGPEQKDERISGQK
jgi:ribose transport system substrate-binding protein